MRTMPRPSSCSAAVQWSPMEMMALQLRTVNVLLVRGQVSVFMRCGSEGLLGGVGDEAECDAGGEGVGEAVPDEEASGLGRIFTTSPGIEVIVEDLEIMPERGWVPTILGLQEVVEVIRASAPDKVKDTAQNMAVVALRIWRHAASNGAVDIRV